MTFAEFQIRLFAYRRVQEREWEKVRFIAWNSLIGFHSNPKKLPKSITEFMKLDIDNIERARGLVSDEMRARFLAETEKYLKLKNNG